MCEQSEKVHATSDEQFLDTKSDDDKTLKNEDPSVKEIPNIPTLCDSSVNTGLKRLPRSQKKRIKQELAVQRKKDLRKEKKQLQRQRQRERAKDKKSKNLEEGTVQPTRKELKEEMKSKLETAMLCGQRICIDLSMENTMTLKEKSKLSQQLCRVYGINRRAELPAHLYFAGFDKNGDLYKECLHKIDGFEKFMVEMTEAPVLEVFNIDDVIYLSPDAPDMLEDLDKDKVYVIGGIVDESIIKKSRTVLELVKNSFSCLYIAPKYLNILCENFRCVENRWKEEKPGIWTGVLFDRIWRLWQSEAAISYQIFGNNKLKSEANEILPITKAVKAEVIKTCEGDIVLQQKGQVTTQSSNKTEGISDNMYADLMKDYFQLNVSVANLYKKWSEVDSNFQSISSKFEGIRTLRQDPVENLFSFICSSNNHISRISTMIEKLCENYGREVGQLDGKTYFSFPTVSEMADDGVESELRNLGFGYRAKYINQSARQILDKGGEAWLRSLREKPYVEAKKELMSLNGVGAKVADCVCLMSLDKTEAVPVDTHVWQIAARGYMPSLTKNKSLTDKLYNEIGDHFRTLWGPYAGWAQGVLFTADLKQFKEKQSSPSKRKAVKTESPVKRKKRVEDSEMEENKESFDRITTATKRRQKKKS